MGFRNQSLLCTLVVFSFLVSQKLKFIYKINIFIWLDFDNWVTRPVYT